MDTSRLMTIALEMAGQKELPADSAVQVPGRNLRKALVGVDIGEAELLMAKQLGCEVVIAHHPTGGPATLDFHRILEKQYEFMVRAGVAPGVARQVAEEMKERVEVRDHAANYDRTPAVARLLGLALLNVHNPLDELGRRVMAEALGKHATGGSSVAGAVAILEALPEFKAAATRIAVRLGSPRNRLGKYVVHHGAGTNGGFAVARAYFEAGVDTVFYIHIAPEELRRLREDPVVPEGKNLVVTGHMASDSVGINPYVRRLRAEGLEVVCAGGVIEVQTPPGSGHLGNPI
jgi:putative NIF3 family GTP cyclohydrolase 1 type 2